MAIKATDAQQRAARFLGATTRDDAQKLARIEAAKRAGMVLNGDKHAVPFEPGKIAMSLEFGSASLRWNSSPAEFAEMFAQITSGFVAERIPVEEWRQIAREGIAQTMNSNQHLDIGQGSLCAMLACFLMLDHPANGSLLRAYAESGALRHAGYIITMTEPPNASAPWGALNFRLIAGNV